MTKVNEQEFNTFISTYNGTLEQNFYMDWYCFHDFNKGKDSIVAMRSTKWSEDDTIVYKIDSVAYRQYKINNQLND